MTSGHWVTATTMLGKDSANRFAQSFDTLCNGKTEKKLWTLEKFMHTFLVAGALHKNSEIGQQVEQISFTL